MCQEQKVLDNVRDWAHEKKNCCLVLRARTHTRTHTHTHTHTQTHTAYAQVCEEALQHAQLKREGKVPIHGDFVFVKERYQLPGDKRMLPGSLSAAPACTRTAGGKAARGLHADSQQLHQLLGLVHSLTRCVRQHVT